ncbi:MAG: hypothetical protein K1X28_06030 [Parachlamydiales bacterium]|nr:hypothetical protein [Parachlamydiales bacterium]
MCKKKEIAELIRLICKQGEFLEPSLSMFVEYAYGQEAKESIDRLFREEMERLQAPFDELFTGDEILLLMSFYREIKRLVSFYQSDAMKKLLRNRQKLFSPFYNVYLQIVQESSENHGATGTLC